MYDALGLILEQARLGADVSINDVARRAEMDKSTIWRLETGRLVAAPRNLAEILTAYSTATSVPEAELLARWGAEVARQSRGPRRQPKR